MIPAEASKVAPKRKHSKGNKHRGIRMDDDLWTEFQAATKTAGVNASETIRGLMRDWIRANEMGEK